MPDISVIILTYNEEIHIERCIRNISSIASKVYIVDSYSTDNTIRIAQKLDAFVYQNKWENNYAKQFNWALDNLPIDTEWVLRLDADEYLTDELIHEIQDNLKLVPSKISGIVFKRRHIFLGKWIKRGVYPVKLLRLFRNRKAICEQRLMDEHIQLLEGESTEFEYDFVDHNLNDLSWWTNKHVGYAIREAVDLLNIEHRLFEDELMDDHTQGLNKQAAMKRRRKESYAKKPLFVRSFMYFIYRYIIKMGIIEGKEGFLWHFLQGWWYRTLVDAKVFEIKKECNNNREKIIRYLQEKYNINCR